MSFNHLEFVFELYNQFETLLRIDYVLYAARRSAILPFSGKTNLVIVNRCKFILFVIIDDSYNHDSVLSTVNVSFIDLL